MNFQELMRRMVELDRPVIEEPNEGNAFSGALDAARDAGEDNFEVDGKIYKVKEDGSVEECGMGPSPSMMRSPPQSDSVNMNVSLNASGSGGIRDLMSILKTIEDGGRDHDIDPELIIRKMSGPGPDMDNFMGAEDFANEPDEMYSDINYDAGGDLNRPKGAYAMAQPGDNAMAVESLKKKLQEQYNQIKNKVRENNQLVEKFEYSSGTKLGDEELRKRAKDQGYDLDKNTEFDDPRSGGKASFKHTPHASLLDPDWSQPRGGLDMRDPEAIRRSLDAQMKTQDWQSKSDFDKAALQALRAQQIIDAEKYQSKIRNPAPGPAPGAPANKSEENKQLQIYLNKKYNAGLQVDGIVGPKTKAAIDKFMK